MNRTDVKQVLDHLFLLHTRAAKENNEAGRTTAAMLAGAKAEAMREAMRVLTGMQRETVSYREGITSGRIRASLFSTEGMQEAFPGCMYTNLGEIYDAPLYPHKAGK